jgi:hypothetical protein
VQIVTDGCVRKRAYGIINISSPIFSGDGREMPGGRIKMPAERLKEEKADGTETFH